MKEKLISIILPVYNSKKERLCESIDSVLNQSYQNFELIIINDASTNDIEKTIKKYENKDSRIVYIKNEKNLRLTKTLNKGLNIAKGEYIARIDDDDIWVNKDKLEKQVEFMEKNSEYGICGTNITHIDSLGNIIFYQKKHENDDEIKHYILRQCPFSHSSVLFKKECITKFGGYSTDWDYLEDHELWIRIGEKYKFYNLQDYAVSYRVNPNGICSKHRRKQRWNILKLSIIHRKDYPCAGISIVINFLHFILSFFPMKFVLFLMEIKNGKNPKH